MAASKQNRKQRPNVLIADACQRFSVGYVSQGVPCSVWRPRRACVKAGRVVKSGRVLPQGRDLEGLVGDCGKDFFERLPDLDDFGGRLRRRILVATEMGLLWHTPPLYH